MALTNRTPGHPWSLPVSQLLPMDHEAPHTSNNCSSGPLQGTAALLDFVRKLPGTCAFVHVSTTYVNCCRPFMWVAGQPSPTGLNGVHVMCHLSQQLLPIHVGPHSLWVHAATFLLPPIAVLPCMHGALPACPLLLWFLRLSYKYTTHW